MPSPKPTNINIDKNGSPSNSEGGVGVKFQSGGNGLYSPITAKKERSCIEIDFDKVPGICDLSSGASLILEPRPNLDQLEQDLQVAFEKIARDDKQDNAYDQAEKQDTIDDEKSRNADATMKTASIDDFINDTDLGDADMIQMALSIASEDDQVSVKQNHRRIDRYERNNKYAVIRNSLPQKFPVVTPSSSSSLSQYANRGERHPSVTTNLFGNPDTSVDNYSTLLPQVTFDEEDEGEVFDRRTFFDQALREEERVQFGSNVAVENPFSLQSFTKKAKPRKKIILASKITKHKHWSEEEDETLRQAMDLEQHVETTNWTRIARYYFSNTRSASQCKNRWKNYLKPGIVHGNWQKYEDDCIIEMVSQGFKWVDIAKCLPGRIGEHVRARYVNFLDDKLKKTSWTPEEDKILFESQRMLGNKWCEIRKLLPGRSDNAIKNRFHNRKNAEKRRQIKRKQFQQALLTQR